MPQTWDDCTATSSNDGERCRTLKRTLAVLWILSDMRLHRRVEIAQRLSVNPRTILRDLRALNEAGFAIYEDTDEKGVHTGYYRLMSANTGRIVRQHLPNSLSA